MKTMSKKLASIVLALCLCFSLVGTALAATSSDATEFSITVTNAADGETYSAYKIFDVTYSYDEDAKDGNYSYTIDSSSAWWDVVEAASNLQEDPAENPVIFILTQIGTSTTYIVTVDEGVTGEQIAAALTPVPEGAAVAATATASDGQAYLDVTSSGAGYYYVTTSLGSLVIIDTTNPTQTIEEKNGIPSIEKWVYNTDDEQNEKEDDESNAATVTFELDVTGIKGAVNLVVHDYMEEELEEDWDTFALTSVILYDYDEEGNLVQTVLVQNQDYTIVHTDGTCTNEHCTLDGCTFEVNFTGYDFSEASDDATIVILYTATLNTEDDAYTDDYDEIDNYAQVTFATTSASSPVEAEVYSFGFETYKIDGDTNAPLEGVEFELKNTSGSTAYFLVESIIEGEGDEETVKTIYLFEGWGTPAEGSNYTTTLVTGEDGMIYIDGLDQGTYTLTETKALDGYNPLTGDITVTITATYDATGALLTHTVSYTYGDVEVEDAEGPVEIENYSGTILPGTGGMGTTIFYIIGGVLVAGAVVVLITRRRMSSNEG